MDEEIERLVVSVRADTAAFARDVADMRGQLDGPLTAGADQAGRAIEAGLQRAVRTGKFGFEDLRRIALSVLGEIAEAAVRAGVGAITGSASGRQRGGGGGIEGGLLNGLAGLIGGLAGRATGGPVAPGVAYLVGERGPELFVPTASGRVETVAYAPAASPAERPVPIMVAPAARAERAAPVAAPAARPPERAAPAAVAPPVVREVRVAITVNARPGEAPAALAKSSRQVARAVRSALGSID